MWRKEINNKHWIVWGSNMLRQSFFSLHSHQYESWRHVDHFESRRFKWPAVFPTVNKGGALLERGVGNDDLAVVNGSLMTPSSFDLGHAHNPKGAFEDRGPFRRWRPLIFPQVICESCCSFFVAKREVLGDLVQSKEDREDERSILTSQQSFFLFHRPHLFFRCFWASRRSPRTHWNLNWNGQRTFPDLEAIHQTRRYGLCVVNCPPVVSYLQLEKHVYTNSWMKSKM